MHRKLTSGLIVVVMGLLAIWTPAAQGADDNEKAVVPVFSLRGPLLEKPVGEDLMLFGGGAGESLKDLIARMNQARDDDAVKGVVLLWNGAFLGRGQTEEIRRAMDGIKAAGKDIHVHADFLTTGSYTLLSGASRISMPPTGHLFITGFYVESPYLRSLFDKIGIEPDALTCGAYKSAAEIFMRTGPSPKAHRMTEWLVGSLFDTSVDWIAKGRGVTPDAARGWIDVGLHSAEGAKAAGIIDAVQHRQDFTAELRNRYGGEAVTFDKRYGKKKGPSLDFSSPFAMFKIFGELFGPAKSRAKAKDAIAIVYVEGAIVPGQAAPSPFPMPGMSMAYSTPIQKALDKAAKDESIKGVVLRVNSPGGSAVASEIILDATRRVAAAKPFVVSMGDVAGSGGYYVACGAETIYADASTITASIGVVASKLATTGMWNKIGIDWHSTQRGKNAGLLSSEAPFNDRERERLQGWMDEVYETFKGHVVKARGDRLTKPIDELAGGRVFTGQQALGLGLVDKIGGLDEAIRDVAGTAGLTDYDVRVVPKPKNLIELLMADFSGRGDSEEDNTIALTVRRLLTPKPTTLLDAARPYLKGLDPQRLAAVEMALQRLNLLEREPVLLAMPEIIVRD